MIMLLWLLLFVTNTVFTEPETYQRVLQVSFTLVKLTLPEYMYKFVFIRPYTTILLALLALRICKHEKILQCELVCGYNYM